jgi:hypothetical protein
MADETIASQTHQLMVTVKTPANSRHFVLILSKVDFCTLWFARVFAVLKSETLDKKLNPPTPHPAN